MERRELLKLVALTALSPKVDVLQASFEDHVDPELFGVIARIKDPKDVNYVRDEIIKTFDRFAKEQITAEKLEETRSHVRYGTALGWTDANANKATKKRSMKSPI